MKDPLAEYEDRKSPEARAKKKEFDALTFKKVMWVTAQMAKRFDRDIFLATNARETLFYVVFVLCITVAALAMADRTMYFMAQSLRAQMVDHAGVPYPETEDTSRVRFYDIMTVDDMWDYVEVHLLPIMYPEAFEQSKERDKGIGKENVMIGVPVIRQVMVTKKPCPDPFPKTFRDCYPEYSRATRHNRDVEGTSWKYQTAKETQGATWHGRVAKYYGDGFQEELNRTVGAANSTIQKLKTGKFVQKGTRAIFIDAAYYNAHVNLFTAVKIAFELPPTGVIIPTANFYTLKLLRYVSYREFLVLACEIIYLILVVFYVFEEIREIVFLRGHYLRGFWNYVDLGVIASASTLAAIRVVQYMQIKELLGSVQKAVDKHNSLQTVTSRELSIRTAMAVAVFMAYFKLFKYLSFNKPMVEIHKALDKSLGDIAALLFILWIVFAGFALFGCLAFGTQLWDFMSFPLALFALLRILLGDFTYDSLREASPIIAPVFYLLFLATVFFIMLNLFLAIIYDCYRDVKMETAILPQEGHMTDFWRTGIYNLMHLCGCGIFAPRGLVTRGSARTKTTDDIRIALRRCGFTDLDIEMFLNRYNIDPDARVRTRDVEKLMDNLKDELPPKPDPSAAVQEPPPMPAYLVESSKPGMVTRREGLSSRTPTVAMSDFTAQQDRLDGVERVMASIAEKLDILLRKLNAFETV